MIVGVRYIMDHPLLPGLYALDWGFTVVSFYRELFPLWVGVWLVHGVPEGVSSRGAVALLVVANYSGGMVGTACTLAMNSYEFKGRLVVYATAAYGVACFAFGCTQHLLLGATAVFGMGACDAVGATMRKQVVLLSTPDELRGRAQSGHQFAAYLANSIGQMYVAFMVSAIGAGLTMQLGGVVTEVMTMVSAWRIPALMTYPRGVSRSSTGGRGTTSATAGEMEAAAESPQASTAGSTAINGAAPPPPGWELNDAAKAAAAADDTTASQSKEVDMEQ